MNLQSMAVRSVRELLRRAVTGPQQRRNSCQGKVPDPEEAGWRLRAAMRIEEPLLT